MTRVFVFWCLLLLAGVCAADGPQAQRVLLLPLPCTDVNQAVQDRLLYLYAKEIVAIYELGVMASRDVGNAVFGRRGTGIDRSMRSFADLVRKAKRSYHTLKIREAQKSLSTAKKLLPVVGPHLDQSDLVLDLFVFSGLVHLAQGQKSDANSSFHQAIVMNPDFTLSSSKYPPDVMKVFRRIQRRTTSAKPTVVRIESQPEGAVVYLDGQEKGETPLSISVYSGRHFLRLALSGHADWTLSFGPKNIPRTLKHLMVPSFTSEDTNPLLEMGVARGLLTSEQIELLDDIAEFYEAAAVVIVSLSKGGESIHWGQRLHLAQSNKSYGARLFDLGNNLSEYSKKLRGIASVLTPLRKLKPEAPTSAEPAARPVVAKQQQQNRFERRPEPRPTPEPQPKPEKHIVTIEPLDDEPEPLTPPGHSSRWYKTWWFWTLTSAVLASVATGVTIYLLQPEGSWNLTIQPKG